MEIYGRNVGMKFTVGAAEEISEFCPDKDVQNLDAVLTGKNVTDILRVGARLAVAMSRGYETAKAFEEGRSPTDIRPLSLEEVNSLMPDEMLALVNEALSVYHADKTPTVEVEPTKNGEAAAERAENPAP